MSNSIINPNEFAKEQARILWSAMFTGTSIERYYPYRGRVNPVVHSKCVGHGMYDNTYEYRELNASEIAMHNRIKEVMPSEYRLHWDTNDGHAIFYINYKVSEDLWDYVSYDSRDSLEEWSLSHKDLLGIKNG